MPSLGADMESGTVVEWRVHPGDAVKRGDIVALVETNPSQQQPRVPLSTPRSEVVAHRWS